MRQTERSWISLKYEGLIRFCHICGRLRHAHLKKRPCNHSLCPVVLKDGLKYGAWLSVESVKGLASIFSDKPASKSHQLKDIADERHWHRMVEKNVNGLYGIDFSSRTPPPQSGTPRPSAIKGQKRQTVKQNNLLSLKALKTTGHEANTPNPQVYNFGPKIIHNPRFTLFWDDPPRSMTLHQDFKSRQMVACGSSLDTHLITQQDTPLQPLLADPEGNSAIEIDSSSLDLNLLANPTRVNSETPVLLDSVISSHINKRQKGMRQRIEAEPRSTRKPKAKVLRPKVGGPI
ncbi:unnamed protein product [Prunus armeniaca]|uniref:Uncharacterized protein n=1 Tax=Prunus armeniaca TaxID=36596 RepID=A0A6J5V811_PRUAR|nr:unnamed protein product [Prunus armeniaca]